jgi:hypothetical protein
MNPADIGLRYVRLIPQSLNISFFGVPCMCIIFAPSKVVARLPRKSTITPALATRNSSARPPLEVLSKLLKSLSRSVQ